MIATRSAANMGFLCWLPIQRNRSDCGVIVISVVVRVTCLIWPHNIWHPPETHLKSYIAKACRSITSISVARSYRKFPLRTVISLLCFVQNFKTILHLKWMLSTAEGSRNMSLRWISDGYSLYYGAPSVTRWVPVLHILWGAIRDKMGTGTPYIMGRHPWQDGYSMYYGAPSVTRCVLHILWGAIRDKMRAPYIMGRHPWQDAYSIYYGAPSVTKKLK